MRRFPRTVVLVLAGLWMTWAGPAAAKGRPAAVPEDADTAAARVHLGAGEIYFSTGKYAEAEREMSEAYRLRPVPELQYNLAQCYERLGMPDRALGSYRAYLEGRPEAADRAEVEGHIVLLLEAQRRQKQQEPAEGTVEPSPAEMTAPPPALVPPGKVMFKEIIVYRAPPPKAGRGSRYVGLGLLGLTVLGLSIGISFSVIGANLESEIRSEEQNANLGYNLADCMDQTKAKDATLKELCTIRGTAVSAEQNGQIAADIGYAIAGAGAAGAIGMFVYGYYQDRKQGRELLRKSSPPSLSVGPLLGPTRGLVVMGRF